MVPSPPFFSTGLTQYHSNQKGNARIECHFGQTGLQDRAMPSSPEPGSIGFVFDDNGRTVIAGECDLFNGVGNEFVADSGFQCGQSGLGWRYGGFVFVKVNGSDRGRWHFGSSRRRSSSSNAVNPLKGARMVDFSSAWLQTKAEHAESFQGGGRPHC